ncbi:MAG: TlpA disulfide reductase family protein [Bacteroidota bacterium]
MKKIFATLLLATSFTIAAHAQYSNETIQLGQSAPDLSFPSPKGEILKISEVNKGRVVLLDFWASWCGPCRRANPGLVALYEKYKGKKFKNAKNGFTVMSVSLDMDKNAWMAAIDKDKLVWPYHMSDLLQWRSKAASVYGLQYIPQAFLIDANGKIVGKYNLAEEADKDIEKLLAK